MPLKLCLLCLGIFFSFLLFGFLLNVFAPFPILTWTPHYKILPLCHQILLKYKKSANASTAASEMSLNTSTRLEENAICQLCYVRDFCTGEQLPLGESEVECCLKLAAMDGCGITWVKCAISNKLVLPLGCITIGNNITVEIKYWKSCLISSVSVISLWVERSNENV